MPGGRQRPTDGGAKAGRARLRRGAPSAALSCQEQVLEAQPAAGTGRQAASLKQHGPRAAQDLTPPEKLRTPDGDALGWHSC